MFRNKRIQYIRPIILIFFVIINISCSSKFKKAKQTLPEADRNFLTFAQYLITNKEKKIFVYLDRVNRAKFIKEFWKKRDPSPNTEENEYKNTYYQRIEEANKLFLSSGKKGWLTDRGRTYVLFGPPERRFKYPMGYSFYEPPVEIWYYGMFPIVFVDKYRDGSYKIEYSSSVYLNQITRAEMLVHPKYDFWKEGLVEKIKIVLSEKGTKVVHADIPYKAIVFHKKKGRYVGTLIFEVTVFENDKAINRVRKNIKLNVSKQELDTLPDIYKIKEPIEIKTGKYRIKIKITDKNSGQGIHKTIFVQD